MLECIALLFTLKTCDPAPVATAASATTLNGFRAANSRTTLRINPKMEAMAREHAQDMARRDELDHANFMEKRGPAGARAENVAYGCKDAPCTIKMWIGSSGHRANMLLPDVKSYGLASATSKSGKIYWALELGL